MGHLIMALLLPLLLQASAPNPAVPSPPAPALAAQAEQQSSPGTGESATPPSPPATPSPRSQDAIDESVEQKIKEALQGLDSDGNAQMSPETEKAIENAVESFLTDPEIKGAIADKIRQWTPPSQAVMLLGTLVPIAFFAVIALLVWLLYRRSQARMRARMEFHQQVLSKFTSGEQFAQFLNTKGSQQLLEGMWGGQVSIKERLLKHVRLGAIFGVLGLGLLGLAIVSSDDGYGFLAVLSLGIGIGFLVSARVTYRLSEKMGLLRDKGAEETHAPGTQP
ncbi:MAG: hypothetical protein HYX73_10275 [Acidobacteria bacterium]|nr:hypothetical protein [Acidobacteriota bacterium]